MQGRQTSSRKLSSDRNSAQEANLKRDGHLTPTLKYAFLSSAFALLGMNQLLRTIAAISETHNPSLRILVLSTMYNRRQNLDRAIRPQVEEFFGSSLVLETVIHRYVGIAEATAMRRGVGESSTASAATFDFMRLFNEPGKGCALDIPLKAAGYGSQKSGARSQNGSCVGVQWAAYVFQCGHQGIRLAIAQVL